MLVNLFNMMYFRAEDNLEVHLVEYRRNVLVGTLVGTVG